jgi:hypothetical protein
MRGTRDRRYYPSAVPTDLNLGLLDWLQREFTAVFAGFESQWKLPVRGAPPEKVEEGMLVYADGTLWNPGSGKGVYVYNGTTWVKL